MSATYSCDGCGVQIAVPVVLGHVIKRDYCAGCSAKASAFLSEEEALRIEVNANFQNSRKLMVSTYSAGGFKLPDVP